MIDEGEITQVIICKSNIDKLSKYLLITLRSYTITKDSTLEHCTLCSILFKRTLSISSGQEFFNYLFFNSVKSV